MRALLGLFLGLFARVWVSTLRLTLIVDPKFSREEASPYVFAFFHGTQFSLLAWKKRRPIAVLVSLSKDGAIQARAMAMLGMKVARGSSSRRGAAGLRELARGMRERGHDAAFAVDGPRGPYGVAKPGAAGCASAVGARVVPVGAFAARAFVLKKAWDRFVLPFPFSRVCVVIGAPMNADDAKDGVALSAAIARANEDAVRDVALLPTRAASAASERG